MTIYGSKSRKCHKCKKTCTVICLVSTNAFGSSDLDCRPPPMRRNTMKAWIERCEFCGYCAPNIEEANNVTSKFIESEEYQTLLKNSELPSLCVSFLCWAKCAEQIEKFGEAAMAYLHAAWVCGDNEIVEKAIDCRNEAIRCIEAAHSIKQKAISQPRNDEVLLLDLLRRANRFDECITYAKKNFDLSDDDFIDKIAMFEVSLCEKKDAEVHNTSEIDKTFN